MAKRQRPPIVAVSKLDKTRNTTLPATVAARLPVAAVGLPAQAPPNSNGDAALKKNERNRRVFDWSKTPFAVFRRTGASPLAVCATLEEAITALKKLPVSVQERAFVAEFKPVTVKTEITI